MLSASTFLLLALLAVCQGASWTYYGDHGPDHWAQAVPGTVCDGQKQSPIDVVTTSAKYMQYPAFDVASYASSVTSHVIMNNGHTVQLSINGNMTVRGGGLPTDYKVAQFHFHWGSKDTQGSEHTINGKMYPMELHIVHYRANESGLLDAVSKPEGLAVLGFMFEVSAVANHDPLMDSLINNLKEIRNKDDNFNVTPQPFRPMLPQNLSTFYRYSGSLTTPPCSESVIWTVFTNAIPISVSQLAEFRAELSGEVAPHDHIVDNYRPVQALHGRTVYRSFETSPPGAAPSLQASLLSMLLVAVAFLSSNVF